MSMLAVDFGVFCRQDFGIHGGERISGAIFLLLVILLMAEILHQLRLVVYLMIYRVLYIPGGWEWDFLHQH